MVEKKPRYRALVGITFPDGERVEAGKLIPEKLVALIPESWYGVKVEEV